MEKRLLLALGLSFLVMLGYSLLLGKKTPPPAGDVMRRAVEEEVVEIETREVSSLPERPAGKAVHVDMEVEEKIVETEKYRLVLSGRGGVISELELKEYFMDADGKQPVKLLSPDEPAGHALSLISRDPMYNFTDGAYSLEEVNGSLHLSSRLTDTLTLKKSFTFREEEYGILVDISFINAGEKSEEISYHLITGSLDSKKSAFARRFIETSAFMDHELLRKPEDMQQSKGLSWISVKNRHFTFALIPLENTPETKGYLEGGRHWRKTAKALVGLSVDVFKVPPQSVVTHSFLLYAGPKDESILKEIGFELEKVVNYGKLDAICRILMRMLRGIHGKVRNYGLAIILLTLTVNVILFPITRYNYLSMQKMQEKNRPLQPKIAQLREKYRDDPQRMNQETMKLYREHGMNPLTGGGCGKGCLTMVLQIPIFFSLYQILMKAIELRGEGFLWAKDLAMPDAAFRLPFVLPILKTDAVNILPLMTVGAMFLQQRLTTAAVTPVTGGATATPVMDGQQQQQQKMMGTMMSVVFGFIFYGFPAGFNLYILTNMLCMAAVQYSLRRARAAKAIPAE